MKVLYLDGAPSPTRVNLFNELGKASELTVTYEEVFPKGRDERWKADAALNFDAVYLKGLRVKGPHVREDAYFCPEIISVLKRGWDAIIINGYGSPTTTLATEWLRLHRIPFYLSVDGGFIRKDNKFLYKMKKHFISTASAWLSTGKNTTDYLVHYGAKREKCFVYPFSSVKERDLYGGFAESERETEKLKEICGDDGRSLPEFSQIRKKSRDAARLRKNIRETSVILSVGQFIPRKGMDVLLRAGANLPADVGIYIVGGQPTDEYIELARSCAGRVHFIDFCRGEELFDYFRAADVFVLATREDIWGLVVNEAMAFALPVITTDRCVAGLEMVRDGYNGEIVPVDDADKLYQAISDCLSSAYLPQYALDSYLTAARYTVEAMARAHMEFLEKALS